MFYFYLKCKFYFYIIANLTFVYAEAKLIIILQKERKKERLFITGNIPYLIQVKNWIKSESIIFQ